LEELYLSQDRKCVFTGEPIDFEVGNAFLDRIDSRQGYVKGNLQWIHKDVNRMKNNLSQSEFLNRCISIHQYRHMPKPFYGIPMYSLNHHKNFKGCGYIGKKTFTEIKRRAKDRNLDFSISIDDLNVLFLEQGGKCALTGKDLFFTSRRGIGNASLDLKNNALGYVKGNIQWIDKNVSLIKSTLSTERLLDICRKITKRYTPVVAVSGYFQILHKGHIDYITEARKLGGYLVVIVNSDKQAAMKSTPVVVNEKSREYIVRNIRGVDETIIAIDEDGTVSKTLEIVRPSIFCNGGDRKPTSAPSKEQETCQRLGIKMIYNVGGEKSDSSSSILQRAHDILSKEK